MTNGPPYNAHQYQRASEECDLSLEEKIEAFEEYLKQEIKTLRDFSGIVFQRLKWEDKDRTIFHYGWNSELNNPYRGFADFDPKPWDPDPEVWPVRGYDEYADRNDSFLECVMHLEPVPHVEWITNAHKLHRRSPKGQTGLQLKRMAQGAKEARRQEKWEQQQHPDWPDERYDQKYPRVTDNQMELNDDRVEALRRISQLWNGEEVNGCHLLRDKLPTWHDLCGDLDQDELKRLFVDPSTDYDRRYELWGGYDWFPVEKVFIEPVYILRKKVYYNLTQSGKTLINEMDLFDNLKGDQYERLKHRFAVGLTAVNSMQTFDRNNTFTYVDFDGYNFDVIGQAPNEQMRFYEILTEHNNLENYRSTYEKLKEQSMKEQANQTALVFDSRETAYSVFDHLHRTGLATLSRGEFQSNPNIEHGRERIHENYKRPDIDWHITTWTTTTKLWKDTLGPNRPGGARKNCTSLNW